MNYCTWSRSKLLVIMLLGNIACAQNDASISLFDLQEKFVSIAEKVRPSVVSIQILVDGFKVGNGSGIVLTHDGYILTCAHVIEDLFSEVCSLTFTPTILFVTDFYGEQYIAEVVGVDTRRDLAVIKVNADGLNAIEWQDKEIRVNMWAFVVGNQYGLSSQSGQSSISFGVISGLDRNISSQMESNPNHIYYGGLVETSARTNPGHSGGPLIALNGKAIGIIVAKSGGVEGAGYAIPYNNNTRRIITDLMHKRTPQHGALGIGVIDFLGKTIVESVEIDGPGDTSGLLPGDIINSVNGKKIRSTNHFLELVDDLPVESVAWIMFVRDGEIHETRAIVKPFGSD